MLIGIDYASVDGNRPPDWDRAKAACEREQSMLGFVILRGAFGTSPDMTVGRDWKRAQEAGLTCGAYLYLRMRSNMPPEDQVHVFADNVGALTGADLPPSLDVEDTGLAPQAELEFLHRAWIAMYDIYRAPPMIYTSARVWHEDLQDLPAGEMADSPLWIAKPWPFAIRTRPQLAGAVFDSGRYEPVPPKSWGWGNWWMHQYQGDAVWLDGFSSTVDLSRFQLMRKGESGIRVAWVQRRLGWPVNRTFDDAMEKRLRAYQLQQSLVADGVIGPKTFARIAWTAPKAPSAAA
jgi:GH25 family lysozyme M1 (1,4-beta-N-acetylmuramidase)